MPARWAHLPPHFFFQNAYFKLFNAVCYFMQLKYTHAPLNFVFVDFHVLYLFFTCRAGNMMFTFL